MRKLTLYPQVCLGKLLEDELQATTKRLGKLQPAARSDN